jgi:hypothetical protein
MESGESFFSAVETTFILTRLNTGIHLTLCSKIVKETVFCKNIRRKFRLSKKVNHDIMRKEKYRTALRDCYGKRF